MSSCRITIVGNGLVTVVRELSKKDKHCIIEIN